MGKIWDYMMTGSWEEMQRIQLYKKIAKKLDSMSKEDLIAQKELIDQALKNK